MINEDYVSFEVAKLLKEKGFHEDCKCQYGRHGSISWTSCNNGNVTTFARPTIQMTMKWLREVHNLHIMVNCVGKVNYDPIVQRFDGKDFEIDGVEVGTTRYINGKYINVRRGFKTFEYACEAAIKYCLENLI